MNRDGDERSLACLIKRSEELKGALVDFALGSLMERHLEWFILDSAGPDEVLIEDEAIDAIDRFALLYRFPNGKTVLDQFLAGWPCLSAADREMLRDLFADPALASDKRYADVLRGYLQPETIGPLPSRRLAVAHTQTVDAVFRTILRQPHFTWADHDEALLRRRKVLVLRARAPPQPYRDRRPPQRAYQPVNQPRRGEMASHGIRCRRMGTQGRDAER